MSSLTKKMKTESLFVLVLIVLVSACSATTTATTTTTSPSTQTTATTQPASTTVPTTTTSTSTQPPPPPIDTTIPQPDTEPPCESEQFTTTGGSIAVGSPQGDGHHISGVTIDQYEECARLNIIFSTLEKAPAAGLPPLEVTIPYQGIVRIAFDPMVQSTSIFEVEANFQELINRIYVVRGLDDRVFIDVHLSSLAEVATVDAEPGQLVIDLRPQHTNRQSWPAVSSSVIVLSPSQGAANYPINITGYTRTFEANVIAWLIDPDGNETEVVFTSAASWFMWGEFELTIPQGPTGPARLMVGDFPPKDDAPFEGVDIGLELN